MLSEIVSEIKALTIKELATFSFMISLLIWLEVLISIFTPILSLLFIAQAVETNA